MEPEENKEESPKLKWFLIVCKTIATIITDAEKDVETLQKEINELTKK